MYICLQQQKDIFSLYQGKLRFSDVFIPKSVQSSFQHLNIFDFIQLAQEEFHQQSLTGMLSSQKSSLDVSVWEISPKQNRLASPKRGQFFNIQNEAVCEYVSDLFDCCLWLYFWKRLPITRVLFLPGKLPLSTLPMTPYFPDKWIEPVDVCLGLSSQQHSSCLGKHVNWRLKKNKSEQSALLAFLAWPRCPHESWLLCAAQVSYKVDCPCFSWLVLNKHRPITLGCLVCQTMIYSFILHYLRKLRK